MRLLAIAFALGLVACGEAAPYAATEAPAGPVATAPRVTRPPPIATTAAPPPSPAPAVAAAPASAAPRAVLERPSAMRRFFAALAAVEDHTATDDARVIQIGDSHTAADWYTGVVRRLLQSRFGDGGRGFVAIGKPWKGYVQDGVRVGMTHEWAPEHARLVHGKLVGDGLYGLSGVAVESARPGGSAWVDVPDTERVDVAYLAQPGGGPFDLLIDGSSVVRVTTKASAPSVQFRGLDVEPGPHRVEVRAAGAGKVRIFGAALDRKSKGVVLDAYGRDGARANAILQWNADGLQALLKSRDPSLVILAFGTNEATDKDVTAAEYERQLAEVVGRIIRSAPTASCLLLGPPDFVQYANGVAAQHPRLAEIIAVQRRVAEAAQCAFYDQVTAMGGAGAIASWAEEDPPRARKDGVHLSREGYSQLAATFVDELVRQYGNYRATEKPSAPPAKPVKDNEPVAGR